MTQTTINLRQTVEEVVQKTSILDIGKFVSLDIQEVIQTFPFHSP